MTAATSRSRARGGSTTCVGLIVGDLLVGLSYGWWVNEHNQHHSRPNQEG